MNNQMWVLGGGRTFPNPSNQVDIYDPVANTWSTGLPFATGRRNFPADSDGTTRFGWAAAMTLAASCLTRWKSLARSPAHPTPTPGTPTPTPWYTDTDTSSNATPVDAQRPAKPQRPDASADSHTWWTTATPTPNPGSSASAQPLDPAARWHGR